MAEVVFSFFGNANGACFLFAILIALLFYYQYKKYEQQAEEEEMFENFLN